MKEKKQLIRNSTAEFLIFTGQAGDQSIEARHEDETIWLTQFYNLELPPKFSPQPFPIRQTSLGAIDFRHPY